MCFLMTPVLTKNSTPPTRQVIQGCRVYAQAVAEGMLAPLLEEYVQGQRRKLGMTES